MYTQHVRCRACGYGPANVPEGIKAEDNGQALIPVFNLGLQPLANDFKSAREEHAGCVPLSLLYCPQCTLAQLSVTVKPEILYANYPYLTSNSATMANHFDRIFDDLHVADVSSVVEIGSNDGRMLAHWRQRKPLLKIVGIDPARNLSHLAFEKNVGTVVSVFNREAARAANAINPDLVIARHVFCHVNDWEEFIASLALMGGPITRYAIEVPYVRDLIQNLEFDTIYHEHLSYLSLTAMQALLKDSPLQLVSVHEYPIHGGAIMMILQKKEVSCMQQDIIDKMLAAEKMTFTLETWRAFSLHACNRILELTNKVIDLRRDGKTVCGFGASAKSTVTLRACSFQRQDIAFICDNTPQKQWKLSPGSNIPVVDEAALIRERPDYCVLFAWNWKDEIIAKNQQYLAAGGKFIVPGKTLEIIAA